MAQKLNPDMRDDHEPAHPRWMDGQGLHALLTAAGAERREPWDGELAAADTSCGLGRLLAEARRWRASQQNGGR